MSEQHCHLLRFLLSLTDEGNTGMDWLNDSDSGKLKYFEKRTCSSAPFIYHKSHVNWPGIKINPLQSEASN